MLWLELSGAAAQAVQPKMRVSGISDEGLLLGAPVAFWESQVRDETSYMRMTSMGYCARVMGMVITGKIQDKGGVQDETYRFATASSRHTLGKAHTAKRHQRTLLSYGKVFQEAAGYRWAGNCVVAPTSVRHVERHHAVDVKVGGSLEGPAVLTAAEKVRLIGEGVRRRGSRCESRQDTGVGLPRPDLRQGIVRPCKSHFIGMLWRRLEMSRRHIVHGVVAAKPEELAGRGKAGAQSEARYSVRLIAGFNGVVGVIEGHGEVDPEEPRVGFVEGLVGAVPNHHPGLAAIEV